MDVNPSNETLGHHSGEDQPKPGRDLTTGALGRHITRLTIPMFLGISSLIFAAAMDTVYVGWLGTEQLAVLAFATGFMLVVMSLSIGFGMGVTSVMSRAAGSGHLERSRQTGSRVLVLALTVSILLGILGWFLAPIVYRWQGSPEAIRLVAVDFTRIWLIGLPLFILPMVSGMMLRALGDAISAGIMMISGSVIQIGLAPLLIFGVLNWEGMGILGAAWGFVISRLIVSLYLIRVLKRFGLFRALGSPGDVKATWIEVLKMSIPVMVSNVIGPLSTLIVIGICTAYGVAVVAGLGVAFRIEGLALMVIMALASSLAPIVGQNFGAGRMDRVSRAMSLATRFSIGWGLVSCVALVLLGKWSVGLIADSPEVVQAAYEYLVVVSISFGLIGVSMVVGSSFVAMGKPVPAFVLSLLRTFGFMVPVAYLLNSVWGYRGLCVGISVSLFLVGILSYAWFTRTLNRHLFADQR